jgi:hypothetical protein
MGIVIHGIIDVKPYYDIIIGRDFMHRMWRSERNDLFGDSKRIDG